MPIPVQCGDCTKKLRVKDESAGRRIKCPDCGSPISVPAPGQARRKKAARREEAPAEPGELDFAQLNALASRSESLGAGEVIDCPECSEPVGKYSEECPHCEAWIGEDPKKKKKKPSGSSGTSSSDDGGSGVGNMLLGAFWFIAGTGITVYSYLEAEPGGKFTLAYGAIFGGLFQFFRGVGQASSSR